MYWNQICNDINIIEVLTIFGFSVPICNHLKVIKSEKRTIKRKTLNPTKNEIISLVLIKSALYFKLLESSFEIFAISLFNVAGIPSSKKENTTCKVVWKATIPNASCPRNFR